jgi:REP-associated tyrosine transposase
MMSQPLVIAYHLIWTGYGWWLPNDPRGSGSTNIRNDVLGELGELHYGRKKIQPTRSTVREFLAESAPLLEHPRLSFDENARDLVGQSFRVTIDRENLTCYACAIMPDHVHILIRKHKHDAETMMRMLRDDSCVELWKAKICPTEHPIWASGHGWIVFLDHPDDIRRTIGYIERNPLPLGLPRQSWSFVKPYDGWPLHPGHSPNSPYVRALRAAGRI